MLHNVGRRRERRSGDSANGNYQLCKKAAAPLAPLMARWHLYAIAACVARGPSSRFAFKMVIRTTSNIIINSAVLFFVGNAGLSAEINHPSRRHERTIVLAQ